MAGRRPSIDFNDRHFWHWRCYWPYGIGQNASLFEVFGDEKAYRISRRPQPGPTQLFVPGKEHRRPDHIPDFLNCVRSLEQPRCNEDEAFIETAVLLMAMESYRLKRQVRWDALKEEIV